MSPFDFSQQLFKQDEVSILDGPMKGLKSVIYCYEKLGDILIVGDATSRKNYLYEVTTQGLKYVQEVLIRLPDGAVS
jgi:ribosomal protein L24